MKNKNITLEVQESINERIKEATVNDYQHKAAPEYIQVLFNRLNEALNNDDPNAENYFSVLSGVKRKIKDIQSKMKKGVCKPI